MEPIVNPRIRHLSLLLILCGALAGLSGQAVAHHCKGSHAGDPGCGGGGGGGASSDTQIYPQDCTFLDAVDDTIRSDGLFPYYQDGVDKVRCSTGNSKDTSNTSRLGLNTVSKGNIRNAIRKVDFVIDESTCSKSVGCARVPDGVFAAAASPDDMEDARFAVQAYAGTEGLAVPHIQDLTPGNSYEVSLEFALLGTAERWSFQMLGRSLPPDFKQGLKCDLDVPSDAVTEDVTLYVWPDDDADGVPDGYTVTTGLIDDTSTTPPTVISGSRKATLCSNVDADGNTCGGPGSSNLCYLVSKMDVQFTWHAQNQ